MQNKLKEILKGKDEKENMDMLAEASTIVHLIWHFWTNFGSFLSIFWFWWNFMKIQGNALVSETHCLGIVLFPERSKWQMFWIFGNMMASSENPFPHIFQIGLKFWEKWEKEVKNQHYAHFFYRRCASGDTLGECVFGGLPMGNFQKFKMLWKLYRQF